MTIDPTPKKIDPPGVLEMIAGGGIAAVVIFSVGVFLLVVPIVGWVVGPSLMVLAGLIAIAHIGGIFMRKPAYAGQCPHCGEPVTIGGPGSVSQCAACKNKFIHRRGQLLKPAI